MALESDPLHRRILGPVTGSAVIGFVFGVVAVAGISIVTNHDSAPYEQKITSDDALLGSVEYGAR